MNVRVIATVPAGFGDEELDLWQLTGLQRGEKPSWFRELVDRDYDGSFSPRWFDHPAQDGNALIVEPYNVCHDELREIIEFADRHALNVSMSAISQHFPTRTLAIHFIPREAA